MNTKAAINRLATGVPGLDAVLGGGLPEYSFNLIAGAPGCGKTTLAHQMMFALATPERSALYFTVMGEPPLKMLRYQQQFDFFDSAAVNTSIRFINLSAEMETGDLEQVLARIIGEVERWQPALVFIDSFRAVVIAGEHGENPFIHLQRFIQRLGTLMTSWQATTFLIGEYFSAVESGAIFTVADGLILLHQSVHRNSIVRKIEIAKMRGQPSLAGLYSFRIGASGIHVFAPPRPAALAAPAAPAEAGEGRLGLGNPKLDAMMGGGLARGSSLLVAGPSGSGKTILANAFLEEGARCGETCVIAAFEQRASRSRGPAIAELIARGQIGVVNTWAVDLSVDEIAALIIAEITRLQASRVVIDSLSGFELSLAPTFREEFRESMARLVAAVVGTGATLLMTSELEDRYDDLRFSPYGTAFLTDAIIVQRYIEVNSHLLRVMAVVKVRGSAHSDALRLFHIDGAGIQIGDMLTGYEGLLGGRPTRSPVSRHES